MDTDILEEEAIEAWLEYSVTEVFESRHWYELAREEFIEEYINERQENPCSK